VTSLQRLWRYYKDYGPDEALFRLASGLRLIGEARTLDIYFRPLDDAAKNSPLENSQDPTVVFREISKEELARLPKADGMPDPEILEKKFRQGSTLFAAVKEGKLIGVNWADESSADLDFIGRPRQSLEKGQVYLHGAHVAPSFRRTGLGSRFRQWVLGRLSKQEERHAFLVILLNPSVAAWNRKNGFKRWGRVFYFQAFGAKRTWVRRTNEGRGLYDNFLRDR
jgi:GNAT superfamily N-acetyltransferase